MNDAEEREIRFHCGHCGRHLVAGAETAGVAFECPHCGAPISVPAAPIEEPGPADVYDTDDVSASAAASSPPGIEPASLPAEGEPAPDAMPAADGPPCPRCGCAMTIQELCRESDAERYPEGGAWCYCAGCAESRRICPVCGDELKWVGDHAEHGPAAHAARNYGCGCGLHRRELAGRAIKQGLKGAAVAAFVSTPLVVAAVYFASQAGARGADRVHLAAAALSVALVCHVLFVLVPGTAYRVWELLWHRWRIPWLARLCRDLLFWIVSLASIVLAIALIRPLDWGRVPWQNFALLTVSATAACYSVYRIVRLGISAGASLATLRRLRARVDRFKPWAAVVNSLGAGPSS